MLWLDRNIFLLDGLGAVLSAVMLGVVLPYFQIYVGMPLPILYLLAILPVFFAVYSLSCFFYLKFNKKILLRIIMATNLSYCLLSLGFVGLHFTVLQPLGLVYFFAEVLVVFAVVYGEFLVLNRVDRHH